MSGFFEYEIPGKTRKRHSLLHAVRKSTSKVEQLGRERVFTWYKGKGKEMDAIVL